MEARFEKLEEIVIGRGRNQSMWTLKVAERFVALLEILDKRGFPSSDDWANLETAWKHVLLNRPYHGPTYNMSRIRTPLGDFPLPLQSVLQFGPDPENVRAFLIFVGYDDDNDKENQGETSMVLPRHAQVEIQAQVQVQQDITEVPAQEEKEQKEQREEKQPEQKNPIFQIRQLGSGCVVSMTDPLFPVFATANRGVKLGGEEAIALVQSWLQMGRYVNLRVWFCRSSPVRPLLKQLYEQKLSIVGEAKGDEVPERTGTLETKERQEQPGDMERKRGARARTRTRTRVRGSQRGGPKTWTIPLKVSKSVVRRCTSEKNFPFSASLGSLFRLRTKAGERDLQFPVEARSNLYGLGFKVEGTALQGPRLPPDLRRFLA